MQQSPSSELSASEIVAVAVRVELAGRVRVDEELVHGVRPHFGVLVDARDHEAHAVVGEGGAQHAADLEAVVLRKVVVVALGRERGALADALERPGRAQVDRAADAALEIGRLGGLQHVRAGYHLGRQHVEREVAAVAVRREDAAVQGDDAELGPEPAHVHELALAAARALHGDARDMRERIGDVVVREAAEVLRDDRVLHDLRGALAVERFDERRTGAGDDNLAELRCRGVARGLPRSELRHERDCGERDADETSDETHGRFPCVCGQWHPM